MLKTRIMHNYIIRMTSSKINEERVSLVQVDSVRQM